VLEHTRTGFDFSGTALDFVYCTDPDGVRIELMDSADESVQLRGCGMQRSSYSAITISPAFGPQAGHSGSRRTLRSGTTPRGVIGQQAPTSGSPSPRSILMASMA